MSEYVEAEDRRQLAALFSDPPRRFGPVAFWFLNGTCDPAELTRQLEEFAGAGFSGVCPCARIGLDPEVGYLTPRWFEVMNHVMAECRRLGLKVILYDEASYPSGSANGQVVEANPDHMARGLTLGDSTVVVDGQVTAQDNSTAEAKQVWTAYPKTTWTPPLETGATKAVGYWRPTTGRSLVDRLVTVVAGQLDDDDRVVAQTTRVLSPGDHHLIRLTAEDFPGRWRLMALYEVPSGGRIRGAYAHNDDGSPVAPAAANLLDPAAVASFIRLTHDAYAEHLAQWFGDPIVAMFTDEPDILGRFHRKDVVAWHDDLLSDLDARLLPSLFVDYDDDQNLPTRFTDLVAERLSRVYYGAQRRWCDEHGIALTGHPSPPDELSPLDHFTWPGQDAVWRWTLPGPTALHGRESATARTAGSAAAARGIRTVLTEVLGAYGWRLSLDEAKWLLDWHLVRGTTLFALHAFFESVQGNRAFESEPDLGLHNAWWPHFDAITAHLRRATMVLRSLTPAAEVAVVTGDRVPTEEVAALYERQVTFDYLTPAQVEARAHHHRAVVATAEVLAGPYGQRLRSAGVHTFDDTAWLDALTPTDFTVIGGNRPDLRVGRWTGGSDGSAGGAGDAWWLLVNEGEDPIELGIESGEIWDPWTGSRHRSATTVLNRRSSIILAPEAPSGEALPTPEVTQALPIRLGLTRWQAFRPGGQAWPGPDLGDWTTVPALETWAGTVRYRTTVSLDEAPQGSLPLDLGEVGELARIFVNGTRVADLVHAPYVTSIASHHWRQGENVVEVLVSNSSANAFEGALRPSGLIGPVVLG